MILFTGCEYNLTEENFVEIEPPSETRFFDLDLIPAGDTIKIFKKTNLNFSFNTDGLDLLFATMTLQDNYWEFYSNTGSVIINPKKNEYGLDTLSLSIYLKSGTGSIADYSGMEGYYLEKKWIVILDGRPAPKIIPSKHINDDGFLVIEWPKCDRLSFVSYELSSSSSNGLIQKNITDLNQNYFIDSLYVGGDYFINVNCRLENSHTWGESLRFYEDPPQMNIEELGFDSLRITWSKSPYNAKYRLEVSRSKILYFNSPEDTACTIPQIGFGKSKRFALCTRSMLQEEWPDISSYYAITSYNEYYLGERIISANWPEFVYNFQDKVLYTNEYNNMKCIDIDNYSILNSVNVHNLLYEGIYSCPTNSSKVAALALHNIYIFGDQNLSSPLIIQDQGGADHFILTDNDKVAYASNKVYKLYDLSTKQITSIDIPDYPVYSKWACITTSQDAKYMCSVTRKGIKIYQIEDGHVDEIYVDSRNYRSAYFNPFHPDQLYLTLNEERGIEIRDPKDFSLVDKIDIPAEMVIRNIDPEIDNVLVTDYVHLFIIDTETHDILLKVPCDEAKSWLYNNHLFTNTGFGLNVSESL